MTPRTHYDQIIAGTSLMWQDLAPAKEKTTERKILEGCKAYAARFGLPATRVQANAAEVVAVDGVEVVANGYVQPGTFYIGQREG